MKQQKRKGFTLVELLIVIAILAVLATVSIVGYISFVKKAQVSNDTALVKQINDLLMADEVIDGKPDTLGGALAVVSENGFDVTKLTPTADGYDFVYDIENNRFALMDNDRVVYSAEKFTSEPVNCWVMRASIDETRPEGYSVYLTKSVEEPLALTSLVGVEVAEGCEIANLTIDSTDAKSIVLAGKIGTLTITAENATIHHYDEVGNVEIISVDKTHSYHEHGTVTGKVAITSGHFVAEIGSVVNAVVVKSAENVTIKAESGSTVNGVVPAEDVTLDTTKLEGISSDIISSEPISEETLNLFAGGIGTEKSPFLVENATQFNSTASKHGSSENKKVYFKLTKDIEDNCRVQFNKVALNIDIDLDGHNLTSKATNKLFQIDAVADKYCSLSIRNGSITTKRSVVGIWGIGAKLLVENCKLLQTADAYVISTNGNAKNIDVTILNSELELKSNYTQTLFFPSTGNLTIKNSTVIGYTIIKGGNTVIEGTTFVSPFTGFPLSYDTDELKLTYIESTAGGAGCIGAAITVVQVAGQGYSFESFSIKNSTVKFGNQPNSAAVYQNANAIEAYNLISGSTMNVTVENITYDNAGYSGYGEYRMFTAAAE